MEKRHEGNTTPLIEDQLDGTHLNLVRSKKSEQVIWTAGFSQSGNVLDPAFNAPIVTGGVTFNQASGSLNVLAGTTANGEFLARSVESFKGSMRQRFSIIASQRIANNNFAILLADLLGEGLAFTIQSSTRVSVNIPGHKLPTDGTANGQFVFLAGIAGGAPAGCIPGRYAIFSVPDEDNIIFAVAGWPASGAGTLTLFGRNYVRNLLTGTTPTNINVDAQRNGWATGDTVAAINTTASPGTIIQAELTGRDVFWDDSLKASVAVPNFTTRASRYENIPDDSVQLWAFIWNFNGSVAPASNTTFTTGHIVVEKFANDSVYVQGFRSHGSKNPLAVLLQAGAAIIGSVNIAAAQTLANLTNLLNGQAAHDAAVAGAPLRIGARAVTANFTPVASNDAVDLISTTVGAQVVRPFSIPENDWQASINTTVNTAVVLQAAAGAGLKRYTTGLSIQNKSATVATEVQVLRGTTVIWGPFLFPINSPIVSVPISGTPLQTAANEALNIQALTAGANVQASATGCTAP